MKKYMFADEIVGAFQILIEHALYPITERLDRIENMVLDIKDQCRNIMILPKTVTEDKDDKCTGIPLTKDEFITAYGILFERWGELLEIRGKQGLSEDESNELQIIKTIISKMDKHV